MGLFRRFQLTPTQRRLLIQFSLSHFLAGLGLLTAVALLWPAGADFPPAGLVLILLLAAIAGPLANRNLLREAGELDRQLARLAAAAPVPATDRPADDWGLTAVLAALEAHFSWLETAGAVLDDAAHRDDRLTAAAAADQRGYQQVRARLRTAQAELAALTTAGRAGPAKLEELRGRLRELENDLGRWQQSSRGPGAAGGDEQLARWRAGQGLQVTAATASTDGFDLTAAGRRLKLATRTLSVKATLLFLWMFFVQTARGGEVLTATLLTVSLSAYLLHQTGRMAAALPLAAVIHNPAAQQLRLQRHWRRASAFLLDAFWFSVLLLTWRSGAGLPWLAGLWLLVGVALIAWEGWGAVQVMDRSARPLPAGDQWELLQAARRQERTLRSATVTLVLLAWVCYTQELIAFPPRDSVTWLVTLSLVGSLTRLIPPLTATWFQRRWRAAAERS